jgi:hypothetical protein
MISYYKLDWSLVKLVCKARGWKNSYVYSFEGIGRNSGCLILNLATELINRIIARAWETSSIGAALIRKKLVPIAPESRRWAYKPRG